MANHGMLPSFLANNHSRFRTPVAAIILQAATTAGLMVFNFDVLVVLDTFFNNISLVLEVIVFLKLKHKRPDLRRPYAVPGGLPGAWICSTPKFLIIGYAFWSVGFSVALAIGVGCNVLFLIAAWVWLKYTPETGELPPLLHLRARLHCLHTTVVSLCAEGTVTRHIGGRRESDVIVIDHTLSEEQGELFPLVW